jgi:SAM-dependent methyltransferase
MNTHYDQIGVGYSATRRADPRIVSRIVELLDLPEGSRVLDVGAGTGSYTRALAEFGFRMTALEPSTVMREQASLAFPCTWVTGVAEALPFDDRSFDGAVLVLCIHHFSDVGLALVQIRRVVGSGPIVIFTYDPGVVETPWLFRYFPAFRDQIRASFPHLDTIRELAADGETVSATPFPLPHDLADGFAGSAWRTPERYLDLNFRNGTSAFRQLERSLCEAGLTALSHDLDSGTWDDLYGGVRDMSHYDHGYTFITIEAGKNSGGNGGKRL